MNKLFAIILTLISFNLSAEELKFFTGSADEAFQVAKEENKLIFVDFYATWCGPCKEMSKTTLKDESVINYLNTHFITLKVDVDQPDTLFKDFIDSQIDRIPYLAFFNTDQMLVGKMMGMVGPNSLITHAKMYFRKYSTSLPKPIECGGYVMQFLGNDIAKNTSQLFSCYAKISTCSTGSEEEAKLQKEINWIVSELNEATGELMFIFKSRYKLLHPFGVAQSKLNWEEKKFLEAWLLDDAVSLEEAVQIKITIDEE